MPMETYQYLRALHPPLNGTYHSPREIVSYDDRWYHAANISPIARAKYDSMVQQEIDQAILES
jgi:hypothetical protein